MSGCRKIKMDSCWPRNRYQRLQVLTSLQRPVFHHNVPNSEIAHDRKSVLQGHRLQDSSWRRVGEQCVSHWWCSVLSKSWLTASSFLFLLYTFAVTTCGMFVVETDWYRIFGADVDADIREQDNSDMRNIGQCYIYIVPAECGYQLLVTKIRNAGRISYILTNFIPNISALNS